MVKRADRKYECPLKEEQWLFEEQVLHLYTSISVDFSPLHVANILVHVVQLYIFYRWDYISTTPNDRLHVYLLNWC